MDKEREVNETEDVKGGTQTNSQEVTFGRRRCK